MTTKAACALMMTAAVLTAGAATTHKRHTATSHTTTSRHATAGHASAHKSAASTRKISSHSATHSAAAHSSSRLSAAERRRRARIANTAMHSRKRAHFRRAMLYLNDPSMPPAPKGTFESLEHQNLMSEAEGLERIENEDDLADRIAHRLLVPVPASEGLTVNPTLPENHRYCRQWTADFLSDLADAHMREFHRPLFVSSAVRTVEYQKKLMRHNGNAAQAEGDIVSPHLTGATIDIEKHGMTKAEVSWMRLYLAPLQDAGKLDVEEEFRQACFHISVYQVYTPGAPSADIKKAKPEFQITPAPQPETPDREQSANTAS